MTQPIGSPSDGASRPPVATAKDLESGLLDLEGPPPGGDIAEPSCRLNWIALRSESSSSCLSAGSEAAKIAVANTLNE